MTAAIAQSGEQIAGMTCNILVVDDEPSNLLALEAILEPLGQNLVRATSGREALLHALRTDFALILLDVQMPGMDGFECAELLRARAKTRDVPIIFVTAISKDREYVTRGYDVGAADYLFKPYDPEILKAKVLVFVELARKNAIIRAQHEALQEMSARELAELREWSDQRYGDLADAVPQVVWTADPSGRITYANRRWRELAGTAPMDLASVVHPDDLARIDAAVEPALADGTPWEAEVRFGSPSVGWRYHVARGLPRRDADGKVVSWVCTSTEMDARVRTERALRILADASKRLGATLEEPTQIEAVLRSLIPLLGDAALLDLEGGPERGAQRLGIVGDRVEKKVVDDPRFDLGPATVRYTQRAELFHDVAREMATTQSGRADHLRFLYELGVSAYMCLPLASRGHCVGTLTLLRMTEGTYDDDDATLAQDLANRIAVAIDNARLHEATEHRRQLLEEANRSKDVFLATLSHELRTPLNAIIGWTDMMRNGQLASTELDRAAETIDRNAHLLASLVADLLDVSRIVTGTLKLDSKLVGLASVVEAAIEAARPQCSSKRVVLDVSLEHVGCVKGDPARLRQVLGNLLSNAIKFTPTGGSIIVRCVREGDRGRIVVQDTGEGITPEFLPHVFERFRQAENARARGLGLGLAIVKHLVEEHGGTVHASSDGKGKGASFTVELPIAAEEAISDVERTSVSQPASGPPELVGVSVLVVEDDPDGNELITTILERYGARVTSVGTAQAALDALDAERPDVLVSDIGLPDRDGMDLIRAVRQREELRRLPAIALTAYASKQDAAKAIAAGFDTHVAKPVQPATLGTAVARLVEHRPASSKRGCDDADENGVQRVTSAR